MDAEKKVCSICQGTYTGWGHNAYPITPGRCCDRCNSLIVLPTRIIRLLEAEEGK